MMITLLVVVGLLAYRSLPVSFLPNFSVPTVAVSICTLRFVLNLVHLITSRKAYYNLCRLAIVVCAS